MSGKWFQSELEQLFDLFDENNRIKLETDEKEVLRDKDFRHLKYVITLRILFYLFFYFILYFKRRNNYNSRPSRNLRTKWKTDSQ
jgi:hypothetical protein